MSASTTKVLILSYKSPKEEQFFEAIAKSSSDLDITLSSYKNVDLQIDDSKAFIKLHLEDLDVASFDLVYFKNYAKYGDLATTIANYLNKRGVKFVDKASLVNNINSKIYQYVLLCDNGVRVPDTIFIYRPRLKESYAQLSNSLGLPFVLKDIHGNKGKFNFLINDIGDFDKAVNQSSELNINLLAQRYIANEGDYRLLVFKDKVSLAIYRKRVDNLTHLNNISQGGLYIKTTLEELPSNVKQSSVRAADILDRQVAGVDMVRDSINGNWYCLEVNEGPQLSSGVLLNEKQLAVATFLESYLNRA
jgi:glutathione synthase/RimK-type ligase-like ATP-grasp enzyme